MEKNKKTRIWELDAFRGICIIGMAAVHLIWDLDNIFMPDFDPPALYDLAIKYGALLFIFLSGLCATLGSKSLKRGAVVFGCGLLVTAAFEVLGSRFDGFDPVYFGILHLLGACMIAYPLFKNLPLWLTALFGMGFIWLGFYFEGIHCDFAPLLVLGIKTQIRGMSDYFPLFPNLGYFLLGSVVGRLLYKNKKSLLPNVPTDNFVIKALTFCGRQSLFIYILHQPVIFGILLFVFKVCLA